MSRSKGRRELRQRVALIAHVLCPVPSRIHSLLDLEPRASSAFGLPRQFNTRAVQGLAKMAMLVHSKRILSMVDNAIGLIGPDHEFLTELLKSTGKRHAQAGVKVQFIPFMGKAVIRSLKEFMGNQWSDKLEYSWEIVMDELCEDVIASILEHTRKSQDDENDEMSVASSKRSSRSRAPRGGVKGSKSCESISTMSRNYTFKSGSTTSTASTCSSISSEYTKSR